MSAPSFSRVSQLRWLSVAVAVIATVIGTVVLLDKVAGCPHDHTFDGPCLDQSTYSPHVLAGWTVIAVGWAVAALVFAGTWTWRRHHD